MKAPGVGIWDADDAGDLAASGTPGTPEIAPNGRHTNLFGGLRAVVYRIEHVSSFAQRRRPTVDKSVAMFSSAQTVRRFGPSISVAGRRRHGPLHAPATSAPTPGPTPTTVSRGRGHGPSELNLYARSEGTRSVPDSASTGCSQEGTGCVHLRAVRTEKAQPTSPAKMGSAIEIGRRIAMIRGWPHAISLHPGAPKRCPAATSCATPTIKRLPTSTAGQTQPSRCRSKC
jgi:hypothetical protein